jgi:ABC-type cobalamin/Fe3+-siderophores transport system ATPase subunit
MGAHTAVIRANGSGKSILNVSRPALPEEISVLGRRPSRSRPGGLCAPATKVNEVPVTVREVVVMGRYARQRYSADSSDPIAGV